MGLSAIQGILPRQVPEKGEKGSSNFQNDPWLKGRYAPKGIKVEIMAAVPTIIDPTGMAFADDSILSVAKWRSSDRMYVTWDNLKLPDGGIIRVTRRRKTTVDIVKSFRHTNNDGIHNKADVVDGAELPSASFPCEHKPSDGLDR